MLKIACIIFGHRNSGDYHHHIRVWQRCARCDGWFGWMFHWETPWAREDGLAALTYAKDQSQ